MVTMACKLLPEKKYCTQICNLTLDCGHKCRNLCANDCTTKDCEEIVQKNGKLACGHNTIYVLCCDNDKGNICKIIIYIYIF